MQFATSTYDTAHNTRLVPLASLQANFAKELKKENNNLPNYGWYPRCIMGNIKVAYTINLTIQSSTLDLQTDPRLRVTKYSLS